MMYHWRNYLTPRTLNEALDYLNSDHDHPRIIAGCTDLIVSLEKQDAFISTVMDIGRIPELSGICIEDNRVKIGANVTLTEIQKNQQIQKQAPHFIKAVRSIGSVQIRNIATLAGNIGNASPAADGVLPLLTLNGVVTLKKKHGVREMSLDSFLIAPGRTAIEPDELIAAITFSIPEGDFFGSFQKLGLRKAMNIAVANVAVLIKMVDGKVTDTRISLGAVGPTAIRAFGAEKELNGSNLTDQVIARIGELGAQNSSPIDDIRASAGYRRKMIRALVIRCLQDIREQIETGVIYPE